MPNESRAVAFDLDAASLMSLRKGLPAWDIEVVSGASPASLGPGWDPGTADLLIVMARAETEVTLGLCRFLAFRVAVLGDGRRKAAGSLASPGRDLNQVAPAGAPLLVLVPAGQGPLVTAALKAGADGCLVLPIHPKQVASMVLRAHEAKQPGRHTLNLEPAQAQDRWRDDGGQG